MRCKIAEAKRTKMLRVGVSFLFCGYNSLSDGIEFAAAHVKSLIEAILDAACAWFPEESFRVVE